MQTCFLFVILCLVAKYTHICLKGNTYVYNIHEDKIKVDYERVFCNDSFSIIGIDYNYFLTKIQVFQICNEKAIIFYYYYCNLTLKYTVLHLKESYYKAPNQRNTENYGVLEMKFVVVSIIILIYPRLKKQVVIN